MNGSSVVVYEHWLQDRSVASVSVTQAISHTQLNVNVYYYYYIPEFLHLHDNSLYSYCLARF